MKSYRQIMEQIHSKNPNRKLEEIMYSPIRFGGTGWTIFNDIVDLNNQIENTSNLGEQIRLLSAQNVEIARMAEFLMAFQEYENAQKTVRGE